MVGQEDILAGLLASLGDGDERSLRHFLSLACDASRGALFDAAREAGAYSNLEKHGSGFLDLHGLSVGHQVEAPGLVAPEQRGPSAHPAARKAQAAPERPGAQPQRHASSP